MGCGQGIIVPGCTPIKNFGEVGGMEWQTLKVEENRDDHYAIVSFNRPEAANALSTQMAKDIISVMEYLTDEIDIWAVILTGSGEKAFCAGADLKERKDMTKDQIRWQRALFVRAFQSVLNFPKPIIAAVNGFAMGGGFEFALCCDFIVAAEEATLALTEVGLGIIPGGGGTQNLPRFIGKQKAKELIFRAKRLSGKEAHEWGIASYVVPRAELLSFTIDIIKDITKNAPVAVYQAKRAINFGVELDLATAMAFEAECYNTCLTTEDRDEGLRAFNEKRKPVFKGK